jgi:tetratricopeptide (TPR) repeat protein
MGLIDEAISSFQRVLGGPRTRLPALESLGVCFIEKGQPRMAESVLQRALSEPGVAEPRLVGILYLLGRTAETLGSRQAALEYYQRVLVIDIEFKDARERMRAIESGESVI